MGIYIGLGGDPEIRQKILIIEAEVRYEFNEELKRTSWFKKHLVERKIRKEIKRRIAEKYGSDYSV